MFSTSAGGSSLERTRLTRHRRPSYGGTRNVGPHTDAGLMEPVETNEPAADQEQILLRWGGVAGMLGAVLLLLTAVTLFGLVPPAPSDPVAALARYPDVRAITLVGEAFSLASVVVISFFYLALFRVLRGTGLAQAQFGFALSLVGLAILAVEGVPDVAYGRISDLYHVAGASAQDQSALVLLWQTTHALFIQYDTASFIFMALGFAVLGLAMSRRIGFGRGLGALTTVLGLAGLVGVCVLGIGSVLFAPLGLSVLLVLRFLLGWKVYRLSRPTSRHDAISPRGKAARRWPGHESPA